MDFDEVVVKESPGLCRCCLSEGCYKDLGSEYSWMGDTEIYADMLLECFDIGISQHIEGPNGPNRLICEVCITRLRDACNFKKQVVESEKKFVDMVGRGEFRDKVVFEGMKTEPPPQAEALDVEYLDDIDFGEEADPEDLLKTDTDAEGTEDITVAALPVKRGRGRPRKHPAVKPEKKSKLAKYEEKARSSKSSAKDEDGKRTHSNNPSKRRRRNLEILFNNTTVIPFKWRGKYLCYYCVQEVELSDLKKHTKSHGNCSSKDFAIKQVKAGDREIKLDVSDISCEICNEQFPNLDEILMHLVFKHQLEYDRDVDLLFTAYKLSDLTCLACGESFKIFKDLAAHVNKNHPQSTLVCDQCSKSFTKKRDLKIHMKNFHKDGGYRCDECGEEFHSNWKLITHNEAKHFHTCNVCMKKFSSQQKKTKHIEVEHLSEEVLTCGFCNKSYTTKKSFLTHTIKCTTSKEAEEEPTAKSPATEYKVKKIRNNIACIVNMSTALPFKYFMNRFRCFYCPKDFVESDDMKEHCVMEHPVCDIKHRSMRLRGLHNIYIKLDITSLTCKVCFESMPDLDTLVNHLITEHKAAYDKTVDNRIQAFRLMKDNYPCPYCPQKEPFRYFGQVLKHMNKVHSNNNLICMFCGTSFRTDSHLRSHISRHHRQEGHKCNDCDMEFPTKLRLVTHMAKIHGTNLVKCPECPEKFPSTYERQKHLISAHNCGSTCKYCGRMFTRNSFMHDHIRRTHLREKKVECTICNMRFFDNVMLKMHMVKHVGDRNFHCDICGKKFLWKKNLRGHMASHDKHNNVHNTEILHI
ncbi:zinc finger protein 569 isoform X2 [Plutella xylostella]|uniref:zinc finger protein 569 isoform X2 n=1 Tax=Plutella xylostella TaxID=51655 RepID=UPI0020330458|nr:zinc finger protein 569 isoform X2 [Plutella xylostella]